MGHDLIHQIRAAVIGDKTLIKTSFGEKPLIYADYTASGRSLDFIEDYIREQVLPFYANTHTETSYTGAQTTALREQARMIIREAVNGGDDDHIIFCGSGTTAAINKLIDILNLRLPAELSEQHQLQAHIPHEQRPVVFIGPYEHHSNEIPWRESIAELVVIPLDSTGQINLKVLEQKLQDYQHRTVKIGSFSAASNVTGIKTDIDSISALLHRHSAIAFWDYAAAAPYVGIDMNTRNALDDCSKDAVFISPHKFIGGPGTPGVLVVKKKLLNNRVPTVPGGGTVMYVTPEDHQFVADYERREEGGTPAIVESIRAGLVFKLQQAVGISKIEAREKKLISWALERWKQYNTIEVLGSLAAERLSIISLRIKHQNKDLHYGFVVALLNDLFGIQARGGCSCAGPYGHNLLKMSMGYSKALETELGKGQMVLRPGWVRLNFNYFIDEETFSYLVQAIELIAEHGWRLLPFYCFDRTSGTWQYQSQKMPLNSNLFDVQFSPSCSKTSRCETSKKATVSLEKYLTAAKHELTRTDRSDQRYELTLPASAEAVRWFVLPQEISLAHPPHSISE